MAYFWKGWIPTCVCRVKSCNGYHLKVFNFESQVDICISDVGTNIMAQSETPEAQ